MYWIMHVYSVIDPAVRDVQSMETERVDLYMLTGIDHVRSLCIENVPALIELCRIPLSQPSNVVPIFELRYA